MDAEELKRILHLSPHPKEGGYYARTWESEELIDKTALPGRYPSSRLAGTCIYYLLEPDTFSEMHRLQSDEIYHFYLGDPIELLYLPPTGEAKTVLIGNNFAEGHTPQFVIPKHVWQGSRLLPGGKFALIGCTVSPGFDFADYESGDRKSLIQSYPAYAEKIKSLTHGK